MSERPDLALGATERAAFLRTALGAGTRVPCATAGDDGLPDVRLVTATLAPSADALVFLDGALAEGREVCVIVERGATYDDITAVVARGPVRDASLALDDLVTFSFAKARPT